MRRRGWTRTTSGTIESYERRVCGLTMRVWRALGAVKWSGRVALYAMRQAATPEKVAAVLEAQARGLLQREARKLGGAA